MIAVLSTLMFAGVFLMIAAVALRMAEESGGKILAALKGQPVRSAPEYAAAPMRVRSRATVQQKVVRVTPRQRAAA